MFKYRKVPTLRKNNLFGIFCLSFFLALFGCGDDSSDTSDSSNNQGENSGSSQTSGPAYEVDGTVTDGSQAGSVQGSSDMSVAEQNYGQVAEGVFTVGLSSLENGLIVFTVDTNQVVAPGTYNIDGTLDGIGTFSWTSLGGIFEGTGGTITIDACPNDNGTRITGRFNDVALTNAATEQADGSFSGTFAVTVVQSDGSAQCTAEPAPMEGGMNTASVSPGPQCTNDTCDGACCPFLATYETCMTQCVLSSDPFDFQGIIDCVTACEEPLLSDAECGPAYRSLGTCAQQNMCEPGLEDNTCIAANCCDEFKAAF